MEKPPRWTKIVQKWLLETSAILTADVSNKNDYKLDKILETFSKDIFWKS